MNISVDVKKICIGIAIAISVLGILVLTANAAEIHGMKWEDSNGSATKDLGELGVQNVTICYYGYISVPFYPGNCTLTDQDGNYSFLNVANGTYRIYEITPPGKAQTYPINDAHNGSACDWCHLVNGTPLTYPNKTAGWHELTVGDSDIKTDLNFGNANTSEIRGTKFNDSNGNGIRDTGELGIPVRINLKRILSPGKEIQVGNKLTFANGEYNFTNLSAGFYKVEEIGPIGFSQTYPASGAPHYIHLEAGETKSGIDFGNWPLPPGNISGKKFNDTNRNGVQDIGENGISGIKITLAYSGRNTTTNSSGDYTFTNVPVGMQMAYEELMSDYATTTPRFVYAQVNSNNTSIINFGNTNLIQPLSDVSISQQYNEQNGVPIVSVHNPTVIIRKNLSGVTNVLVVNLTLEWVGTTKTADMVYNAATGLWEASFSGPFSEGTVRMTFKVDVAPAGPSALDIVQIGDIIFRDPSGQIRSTCNNRTISGAEATLFVEFPPTTGNFIVSPPEYQLEPNPQTTLADGYYSWMTIPGTYKVRATKTGYNPNESEPVIVPPPRTGLDILLTPIGGCNPPPVNQKIGFPDTTFQKLNEPNCRNCHSAGVPDRHHNLVATGKWSCNNCHPTQTGPNGQYVLLDRNCVDCHNGTAFYANNLVNITRPHHINTTQAQQRNCKYCHGSYVANYNDGHYIPTYNISLVTPETHYKIYNSTSGRYWGGCYACHQNYSDTTPEILDQYGTHHNAIRGNASGVGKQKDVTPGSVCNWCHTVDTTGIPLGFPNILDFEIRNSSWQSDPANFTGCEQCHDVGTIHNIQYDYNRTQGQRGFGHIGENWDCNGCHAFWDAGDVSGYEGAIVPDMTNVTPSKLIAGLDTVITITGNNFLSGTGTYTAFVSVDGTRLTPTSINDNEILVTVPGLVAGIHKIQVVKTGDATDKLSKLASLVAVVPTDITYVNITKTKSTTDINIRGTSFGPEPDPLFADLGVWITNIKKGQPVIVKAEIVSWTDISIVARVKSASIGDTVKVSTLNGEDTAKIS